MSADESPAENSLRLFPALAYRRLTVTLLALTAGLAGCQSAAPAISARRDGPGDVSSAIVTPALSEVDTDEPPAIVRHANFEQPSSARRIRSDALPVMKAAAQIRPISLFVTTSQREPIDCFLEPRQATSVYRLMDMPFEESRAAFAHSSPVRSTEVRLASFAADLSEVGEGHPSQGMEEYDLGTPVFAPTFRAQFRGDAGHFLPGLWNDTRAVANWHNGAWILGATGIVLALRADADDEVREFTAEHPHRWGEGSRVLGELGEVQWQVPALLFVYGQSVWTEDIKLYDFSRSLISAYTITGVSTVAIKGIANTERPSDEWNDGELGFPSFHTSSSFTIAAVIEEYYGIERAAPMYVLAGLIGWSRIDERDHDLSDVVFGAMLGYIVGKSVAAYHLEDDPRVRIRPTYSAVNETYGVAFETSY